jgi:hypothetical protein
MQVAVPLPNDKGNTNRVQETHLHLPIGKVPAIDHTRYQWNGDSEKGSQYEPEGNIIQLLLTADNLRRGYVTVGRHYYCLGLSGLVYVKFGKYFR